MSIKFSAFTTLWVVFAVRKLYEMSGLSCKKRSKEAPAEDTAQLKRLSTSRAASVSSQPDSQHSQQPTEREKAAAKAARVRLGYEEGNTDQAEALQSGKLPDGPEPTLAAEVEYVPTEQLAPLEDAATEAQVALTSLQSKDWFEACAGCNLTRRLAVHHKEQCTAMLDQLVPLVLKNVKSLRSSLCKTAVMCTADLFQVYGGQLLPLADAGGAAKPATSLLAQLLLKASSNDKRFVIEEVLRALTIMTNSVAPALLLDHLLPYSSHRNAKVRGRVALLLAVCVAQLDIAALADYGTGRLVMVAGHLISDNTPEARDAARQMLPSLQAAYAHAIRPHAMAVDATSGKENLAGTAPKSNSSCTATPGSGAAPSTAQQPPSKAEWEQYVYRTVSSSSASAILKVTL